MTVALLASVEVLLVGGYKAVDEVEFLNAFLKHFTLICTSETVTVNH